MGSSQKVKAAAGALLSWGCILGLSQAEAAMEAETLLEALERGSGPSKGSPDAPVTIMEFADFQCKYCRQFWHKILPRIEENYIRPGKARFVYRHLALLGPPSVQAAIASECAQAQGSSGPTTIGCSRVSGSSRSQRAT